MAVLEASLEIRESGLGINSRVSENPTRALMNDFLGVGTNSGDAGGDSSTSSCTFSTGAG